MEFSQACLHFAAGLALVEPKTLILRETSVATATDRKSLLNRKKIVQ